jgi:predicted alpha/beta hydrolase family esterase
MCPEPISSIVDILLVTFLQYSKLLLIHWKSRTNRALEEMSKGENIVKWIKGQRTRWLAHLERMEEDRMLKKIFTHELEGIK